MMSAAITAARSAPRSEPANNHAFLPGAKPRSARSAALLVRQILPSWTKRAKPSHQIIDRLDHGTNARAGHIPPAAEPQNRSRRASLLADRQPLLGAQPVDLALDLEQRFSKLGFRRKLAARSARIIACAAARSDGSPSAADSITRWNHIRRQIQRQNLSPRSSDARTLEDFANRCRTKDSSSAPARSTQRRPPATAI
ncbi:hypothetical protein ACVWW2_002244 [Bradyrhizobium sp. LM4.3]